jgi:hypothetical protein
MASNKRLLKAYARFDGSGRIVPSSVIFRKNMPKVGKWKEVQEYLCCNGTEIFYTPSFPIDYPTVRISCDGSYVTNDATSGVYNDVNELAAALNGDLGTSSLGYYAPQSNGSIKLTIPQSVKDEWCPGGTLSFEIIPD